MRSFNFLNRVLDPKASGHGPFLSVYLDTGPDQNGKKDFHAFLRKQVNDHIEVMKLRSPERKSVEADAKKIDDFVDALDPSTRSAALFASSASNDFFESYEFAVPEEGNQFFLFDRPYLFPLARMVDQNPTFAILIADTNSATIRVVTRAEAVHSSKVKNTKTNRTELGGWSQGRYQRHIEKYHERHVKEVVGELEKIVNDERIDRIVVAGDEAVIVPLLREEMSDELSNKVIETIPLNVKTPEHELIAAAIDAINRHDAIADKEKIDYLVEMDYDGGVGVTGFEKTLTALFNGQVRELYLSADPNDIAFQRADLKVLLKGYAPGLDEDLPEINEHEALVDELIKLAAASAERIRFIEDPHLLTTVGGVGAILRYQAKGVAH